MCRFLCFVLFRHRVRLSQRVYYRYIKLPLFSLRLFMLTLYINIKGFQVLTRELNTHILYRGDFFG